MFQSIWAPDWFIVCLGCTTVFAGMPWGTYPVCPGSPVAAQAPIWGTGEPDAVGMPWGVPQGAQYLRVCPVSPVSALARVWGTG